MFKYFTFTIILFFSVNVLSQIIIKDEIELDENYNPNAEYLTMPFYGKITGCVNSVCYDWCGLKLVTIEANGELVERGWHNCGGGWVQCSWFISDVPAGRPVEVRAYICINNVLTEAQTELQSVGTNQYKVRYYSHSHEDWFDATTIQFTPTPPPPCPNSEENCVPGFMVEMPEDNSIEKNPSNFRFNGCDENPFNAGFFTPGIDARESANIIDFDNDDIYVCFDIEEQIWKFELLESPELYFTKTICEENLTDPNIINATIINSVAEVQSLPASECTKLLRSIESHKDYPIGSGVYDAYAFKEILMTHETKHQTHWQMHYVDRFINNYYNIPLKIIYGCFDFSSSQEAKQKILKEIKDLFFTDFWNPYKKSYLVDQALWPKDDPPTQRIRLEIEKRVHRTKTIQDKIKEYEIAIKDKCSGN